MNPANQVATTNLTIQSCNIGLYPKDIQNQNDLDFTHKIWCLLIEYGITNSFEQELREKMDAINYKPPHKAKYNGPQDVCFLIVKAKFSGSSQQIFCYYLSVRLSRIDISPIIFRALINLCK